MARLFNEHIKRNTKTLDGFWKFKCDPNGIGEDEGWYEEIINGKSTYVPSVWNCDLELLEYEGCAWYEKSFFTEGGTLRLKFGAVMTYAKVYFDGKLLGDHYGGFTAFDFILEKVTRGEHKVTLLVDNSFDKKSIPQKYVDWYHYGGITRSVEVELLSGITVLNNRFEYKLNGNTASAYFVAEIYNAADTQICDTVSFSIEGASVASCEVKLAAGERKVIKSDAFTVPDVKLWSAESPTLYEIKAETSTDDIIDRTGFRKIEVSGNKILLNGKEIKICGINRHEEDFESGMAFPPAKMNRDIDIAASAGINAIRGSHYPNNPIFVDLLDERGITFWSEIPIWGGGFPQDVLGDADVINKGLCMHKEMVEQYYNHPSIIIWGMHNEIDSTLKEAYDMSRIYYSYLKENGGNRIVTYATDRPVKDICFEFCDVISINAYCGWYDNGYAGWDDYLDAIDRRLLEIGQGDKPKIMSEFGAAAIYGHHTFDNLPWTEEYQAELIESSISLFFKRGYAGTYIWQFADIRTARDMGLNRARSFNNKGIVNEARRPKLAYYAVKRAYLKKEKKNG